MSPAEYEVEIKKTKAEIKRLTALLSRLEWQQEGELLAQTNTNKERLLYSYAEARKKLGNVPVSTFALWIANGLLHPVRIGPRRSFIKHDELMALAGGQL